ncbi:MAG: hypothetical protein V1874_05015 [Spirochaetota bacterium]
MNTNFIKINSISEINTAKVSVHDLNNRYIDKEGKMYGLKYNRKTRKVSIIRIIRTPAKSAEYFNQMLKTQKIENKISARIAPEKNISERSAFFRNNDTLNKEEPFDLNKFINESVEIMHTHKTRLTGIMMNIKNSRMIQEKDKPNYNQLNDYFRNLEIDGLVRIDKALTDYKEIKNYPRSLTYYLSKLDSKNRKVADELDTDVKKMSFVFAAEMFYSLKTLYRTLFKILNDLNRFISIISPGEPKDITSSERQYFADAKISLENTMDESTRLLENLKEYEEYLNNPKNF